MCSHNDGLSFEVVEDGVFHETGAYVDVHCTQHIIIQIDVALRVEWSCNIHSKFLSITQIDAILAYFSLPSIRQLRDVLFEAGKADGLLQFGLIFIERKVDVVLDGPWQDPWLLWDVGYLAIDLYAGLVCFIEFIEDGEKEHGLTTPNVSIYHIEFPTLDLQIYVF